MAFRNYILCFALVAGTISVPINVQDGDVMCAKTCTESLSDNEKFQYAIGNTYEYDYEGMTTTKLQGASDQSASLSLKAKADIEVISKCEFALKLREVSLLENDQPSTGSADFRQRLQANTLRFAFQDGRIDNLCSNEYEDERVLNIKRGILSAFQNSMETLNKDDEITETDVSGVCPTVYKHESSLISGTTVTKTKDILACTERTGNISSVQSERYNVPSGIQNAPLLSSSLSCEQHISGGKLNKATCQETLMFRPFSKDGSGALTTSTQSLTYSTYKRGVSTEQGAIQARSSLLFSHVYDNSVDMNAKAEVIALLRQICTEVTDDITKNTPMLFGELVNKMKRLDTDKMLQVYNSVKNNRICDSNRGKQFFLDAIPMVSTEASLSLMRKLISDKTVQGTEADMWLTQLAFIPRPSYEMLAAIKPLLSEEIYKTKAVLGISAMVHKICENSEDCHRNAHVSEFVNMLNEHIGATCVSQGKVDRELLMVTLKGIGNAGNAMTSSAVIGRCVANREVDTEIRVEALKAYRRMPCSVSREDAMRLYQNPENDAELRIHAFLAVMKCPTTEVLTKVRMMLSGEPVNQVGSFVWTYLENIKETSSPLRRELSSILQDAKLREDFNLDVRKFSRNLEKSIFSEYLNAGAQMEANLIWSQNSYIPRSAMVNVSLEMFGNSVNLLEVGGRVQGLEKLVEKFFGPNGYFRQPTKELMDNKRQTANYVSPFDTMFNTPDDKMSTSMYIKAFGNEIRNNMFDSDDWAEMQDFNILDMLIKLSEPKKLDLTKNYQFMDSSLIVPTLLGLPMNLTVNGTASISLDMNGQIDLRKVAAPPRSMDINGYIKPSAAVVVSGIMSVDAMFAKTSMKQVATMHTSTHLEGKIQLQNGEIFNVELNTPKDKVEIFDVQTEFFMNGREMRMPAADKTYRKCTGPMVTKVAGVELCADVTLPVFHQTGLPLPPFTGPMNVAVVLEKKDTHTGYKFTAKYQTERQQLAGATWVKRVAHISLDTPGSQVDRKMLLEGIYDPSQMMASTQLMTPWKKFSWSGSLKNDALLKKLESSLMIGENMNYALNAQLETVERQKKTIWRPTLTISMPNMPNMVIDGSVETGTGKTIAAADLSVKKFTKKPITFSANLQQLKGGKSYTVDVNMKSDYMSFTSDGSVDVSDGSYDGGVSLKYTLASRPEHRFAVSGKFINRSAGDLLSHTVQAGLISTEFPMMNVGIDATYERTTNHIDTTVELTQNKQKITMAHKTTKRGDLKNLNVESSSSLQWPYMGIDFSGRVNHQHSEKELSTEASMTYATGKTVTGSLLLDNKINNRYSGEAALTLPSRPMKLSASYEKIDDSEHKANLFTQWNSDRQSEMTVSGTYRMGNTHSVEADFKIPGYPITVSTSVRPTPLDFMMSSDVTYKQQTWSNSVEYKLTADSLTGTASSTCPDRTLSANVNLRKSATQWTADMGMEITPTGDSPKKITLGGEFNRRDSQSFDARLTAQTPIGSGSWSADALMTQTRCRLNTDLTVQSKQSKMSLEFDNDASRTGSFSLESPWIQYGQVKALSGRFSLNDESTEAEFSWRPSKKVTGSASWIVNKNNYSELKLSYTTPFSGYTRAGVETTFDNSNGEKINMKAYLEDKETSVSITHFKFQEGTFALNYPGQMLTSSFKRRGDMQKFTGEFSAEYNTQKLWTKISLDTRSQISLTVDATTPFEQAKQISASFKHGGGLKSFTTQATATWDSETISSQLTFSPVDTKLTLSSPWKEVTATYTLTGDMENFSAQTRFDVDKENLMAGDMNFDKRTDLRTDFKLSSKFFKEVTGSVEFRGPVSDFTTTATGQYDGKSVSANVKYSGVNGQVLEVGMTSPWKSFELTASHNGDLSAWNNRVSLKLDDMTPTVMYSQFASSKYYTFKAGLSNCLYDLVKDMEMQVEHKIFSQKTNSVATFTYDGKDATARVILSKKNGYGVDFEMNTPWTKKYSVQVSHQMSSVGFVNTATVQWLPNKKISTTANFEMSNGFEAKLKIDSPWRNMNFATDFRGDSKDFLATIGLTWETGKTISSSLEFSSKDNLKMTWSLNTPFESMKNAGAIMVHRGTSVFDFYNQIEGSFNEQKASISTNWSIGNNVDIRVTSNNPWKSFNLAVKHNGNVKAFESSVELTSGQKRFWTSFEFSNRSDLTAKFNLNTPYTDPISASFNFDGVQAGMRATWATGKAITADGSFDMSKGMTASASFTTPFKGFESGEAQMSHKGDLSSFENMFEVRFAGKTAKFTSGFTSFGQIKGNMELSSPWYNANANLEHTGERQKFNNRAELTYMPGKTITVITSWSMLNGIDAEIEMESPFKNMKASYNHQKTAKSLNAETELVWGNDRITSSLMLKKEPTMEMEFNMASPWKSVNARFNGQGSFKSRFNSDASFTWDQVNRVSAEWGMSQLNGFSTDMKLNTPWKNVAAEFEHKGDLKNFENTVSVTYEGNTARMVTEFNTSPNFLIRTTITSPIKNANFLYRHTGDLKRFTCHTEMAYDNTGITGDLSWNMVNNMESSFDVRTPWKNVKGEFKRTGDMADFTSSASFEWGAEKIDGSMAFNTRSGYEGAVTVNTPWRVMSANFNHRGDFDNLEDTAELSWEAGKSVSAELTWNNGVTRNGEMKIMSPWRTMAATYRGQGTMMNHESTTSFSWEAGKNVALEAKWNLEKELSSTIRLATPWRVMYNTFEINGKPTNFQSMTEFSWESGKKITTSMKFNIEEDISTEMSLATPWRVMSTKFDFNGSLKSFESSGSLSWEQGKMMSFDSKFDLERRVGGELRINTPWRVMSAEFTHTGDLKNLRSTANLSWESGKRISAEIDSSFAAERREASAKLTTPWRELSATYSRSGVLKNFESTVSFTWEAGKTVSMDTNFNMVDGLTLENKITSPWRNIHAKMAHTGSLTAFENKAEFSWEQGKEIVLDTSVDVTDRMLKMKVDTPWRNMFLNFQHTGDMEDMTNQVEFSWVTGKSIKSEFAFKKATWTGSWRMDSPWRNIELSAAHTGNMEKFNCLYEASWEAGKKITMTVDYQKNADGRITLNTPWRDLTANYRMTGDLTSSFTSNAEFSWETGKQIAVETSFGLEPFQGMMKVTSPWRTVATSFSSNGSRAKATVRANFSWEAGKKIEFEETYDLRSGYSFDGKLSTPWRNLQWNVNQRGEMTDFTNSMEFSWETGKKITASSSFSMVDRNLDAELHLTTPFKWAKFDATVMHKKENTRCTDELSVQWAPNEKIEGRFTYVRAIPFEMEASLKTPFYDDVVIKAEHNGDMNAFTNSAEISWSATDKIVLSANRTPTSGKVSFTSPFTSDLNAELTSFRNWRNWNAEYNHGEKRITVEASGADYTQTVKMTTPFDGFKSFSVELEKTSDLWMVEGKLENMFVKLSTTVNMEDKKFGQTLETSFEGYEKLEWSGEFQYTASSLVAKCMGVKNSAKIEADLNLDVQWKKYQCVFDTTLRLMTPFSGFEDNKMDATVKYSQRLLQVDADGYYGSSSNKQTVNLYAKNKSTDKRVLLDSYVKTTLFADGESAINFDFSSASGVTSIKFNNDFKFAPELNKRAQLDITHQRTDSDLNHSGSFSWTCSKGTKKVTWNAGSNSNMCETGLTLLKDGEKMMQYAHKTTWTSSYNKMEHDMTLTTPYDSLKDGQFKLTYDLSLPKKTMSITMFNEPTKAFDLKTEMQTGDDFSAMVEFTTPYADYKLMKLSTSVIKSRSPWAISLDGMFNDKTVSAAGSMSYQSVDQMEGNLSFTSSMFDGLQMTFKNARLQDQYRPNVSFQWADKKVELSGTFSWTNQYKAAIDLSTPFDGWRSLTADVSFTNQLPEKMMTSFEFKTDKMSKKMMANMAFDWTSKTSSLTISSPFEMMKSLELSASLSPSIAVTLTHNGSELMSLKGTGSFTSLKKHSIDVTLTYPFWNKFLRYKCNCDLDMSDNQMNLDAEFDYQVGQGITLQYTHKTQDNTNIEVKFTSPIKMLENVRYSVVYSRDADDWKENTEFEFYYGKVVTHTTFSMAKGIAYHGTIDGEMKNGAKSFNYNKDFSFTGDLNEFTIDASMDGTNMPDMKFQTTWKKSSTVVDMGLTFNKYKVEYSHSGKMDNFNCLWKLAMPYQGSVREITGAWTIKMTDRFSLTSRFSLPNDTGLTVNFDSNRMDGQFSAELTGETSMKFTSSFERKTNPYTYAALSKMVFNNEVLFDTDTYLSKDRAEFVVKTDNKELMGLRVANKFTADDEYEPSITFNFDDKTYEFDGLYKNEGEGLVRDFKLHLNGPRGTDSSINFKVEFRTQSSQVVPADGLLYLSHTSKSGKVTELLSVRGDIGNDHATFTFDHPQPMKYSIDFTVNTRGQKGEIIVDWDTTSTDKNFKMEFDNKFVSYSKKTMHNLEVDVTYMGVKRGFSSKLNWQQQSFSHDFNLSYNNKKVGYVVSWSHPDATSCAGSFEVVSPLRNMKVTWDAKPLDMTVAYYWDTKDLTKRVQGNSKLETMGTNTYKWTSTFKHPALANDLVFTDNIAYSNSDYKFHWDKTVSFSADSTKDVFIQVERLQNGKWGVELKQEYNQIDMKFGSEFQQQATTGFTNTELSYKASDGSTKRFGLKANYNTQSNMYEIELTNPVKNLKFQLSTSQGETINHELVLSVGRKTYKTSVFVKPADSYLMVKVNYDHLDARNNVEFEAMKLTMGYQVKLVHNRAALSPKIEGLAALSVNDNKTVNGKLYWNPEFYQETKDAISSLRTDLKDLIKTVSRKSKNELKQKSDSMNLGSDFDQIMPMHQNEWQKAMDDFEQARDAYNRAYNQDVLYMKSIDEASAVYVSRVKEEFADLKEKMVTYYETVLEPRLNMIGESTEKFRMMLDSRLNAIESQIDSLKATMGQKWLDQTELISESVEALSEWLQVYIDRVAEYVSEHPTFDSLRTFHASTMNTFNTYSDAAYNKVSGLVDPDIYTGAIYNSRIGDQLATVVSSQAMQEVADSLVAKLKFYYEYYDIADHTRMFLKHTKSIAAEYLNNYLTYYVDQTLNDFKWVVYEPASGRLEAELTIPTQFAHIDTAQIRADIQQRMNAVVKHMAKYHFNVMEMFYMYKPRLSLGDMIPPFTGYAMISGQHIRTFDRRHYNFVGGQCSYLLARDFNDGNFTILANPDQSLTVHSNGHTVNILTDYTVKVDGQKQDLPIEFFNTTITRVGQRVIVNSKLGVEVSCDNEHEICSVTMSGFYFAKTGGLFGTYNNEPLDDFTMSNNQNTSDIAEFANSWSLGSCSGPNNAKVFPPIKNTKEYEACAALFKESSSSLSPCFPVVDPTDAFEKCVNDMSIDVSLQHKMGPCKAAKYYETACKMAGMTVSEPAQCVRCDLGATSIEKGETKKLSSRVLAADVVLVVEEKDCNRNTAGKLAQMTKFIQTFLSNKKFTDVRFGLVGFGGDNVHNKVHTHTLAHKIFAAATDVSSGAERLSFGNGDNRDVFEAIDYAAQYPFRAGATKMVVVIPCSDCSETKLSYRSLAARLSDEKITVHVMNEFSFETSSRNPSSNYLLGIDNKAVFSMKDVKQLKGNTKLYPVTSKPKDQCSYLALHTDGTVFDLNMLTKQRAYIAKSMLTVFAKRMAMTAVPSTCQVCTCEYNEMFMMPRSVCRMC